MCYNNKIMTHYISVLEQPLAVFVNHALFSTSYFYFVVHVLNN